MNSPVVYNQSLVAHASTAPEIRAQVQRIQQVMKAVMKDKVHYGIVPGTPKPSLWKPGAEVLQATFHIAVSYRTDDLSDHDCVRYRVTAVGTHQATGILMGEGMGEASSNEEKYRWRAAVCDEEYNDTDDDRKRVKYKKTWNNAARRYDIEKLYQVRTEPADIANTVLKMACKRAQIAMVLNVTAASDIFTQDLEDMPDGMTPEDVEPPRRSARGKPVTQAPRSSTAARAGGNGQQSTGNGRLNDGQVRTLNTALDRAGIPENEFLRRYNIDRIEDLPFAKLNDALAWIRNPDPEPEGGEEAFDEGDADEPQE